MDILLVGKGKRIYDDRMTLNRGGSCVVFYIHFI